jgi:hypothetical protein
MPAASLSLLNSMLKVSVWHQVSTDDDDNNNDATIDKLNNHQLPSNDNDDNDNHHDNNNNSQNNSSQNMPRKASDGSGRRAKDTFIGELLLPLLYLKDHSHKVCHLFFCFCDGDY